MLPEHLEKIKSLIVSSSVLSPQERAEWTALLGLMNDKQLLELEDILGTRQQATGNRQQAVAQSVAGLSSEPIQKPSAVAQNFAGSVSNFQATMKQAAVSSAPARPVPPPQMPQLSHIVNLPKISEPSQQKKPSLNERPVEQKPKTGFAAKLKSMLKEKELLAGKPELDLPNGNAPRNVTPKDVPVMASKPPVPLPPKPKTPPPLSKQAQAPARPPAQSQATQPPKDPAAPFIDPLKVFAQPIRPNTFTPGVNFAKTSEKSREDTLASIKEHIKQKDPVNLPQVIAKTPLTQPPAFAKQQSWETLEGLPSLDIAALETGNLESFVTKIRTLVLKYSYFETIFNIEKSPLYQKYVNTGTKLLTKQSSFEDLAEKPQSEQLLSRSQFEMFADLLRQIQAG